MLSRNIYLQPANLYLALIDRKSLIGKLCLRPMNFFIYIHWTAVQTRPYFQSLNRRFYYCEISCDTISILGVNNKYSTTQFNCYVTAYPPHLLGI
jgi:hypothetical protein